MASRGQAEPGTVRLAPGVTAAVFPFPAGMGNADSSYVFSIRPSAIPEGAAVLVQVTFNGTGNYSPGLDVGTQVLANNQPPLCTPQRGVSVMP